MTQTPNPSTAVSTSSWPDPVRLTLALLFGLLALGYVYWQFSHVSMTLVVAAGIGIYMAMNIGANDVANNVGPAVGAKAMSMITAIAIAATFEAAGAIIAGGDVVGTIKSGIIDPAQIGDSRTFVWLMMAALLAGALWLNIATIMGAPVSTTHSIVGGVLGAGIAAAGTGIANWTTVGQIVASWLISPLCGGLIAALFLYIIKRFITYQPDLMVASRKIVPVLLGLMAWAFSSYLVLKGLSKLMAVSFTIALLIGAVIGVVTWFFLHTRVDQRSRVLSNDKAGVNALFTLPLMFSAALLSFAHGSNDVANAVGPLAAINDALLTAGIHTKASVPLWILLLGALGLSVGLALYGPRLIRTVGQEITEIDQSRAYCIAMATALTVILASQLGLPISTTHVTIGAVFGVGFLREFLKANYQMIINEIEAHHAAADADSHQLKEFLARFEQASRIEKGEMLAELKAQNQSGASSLISKRERKNLKRIHRADLVKRSVVLRVIAAWIITVPASAIMAAIVFYAIRGALLP